jgi:hypothetical protein
VREVRKFNVYGTKKLDHWVREGSKSLFSENTKCLPSPFLPPLFTPYGKTQTSEYSATYVVREGEIVSGRQKLIARE